MEKERKCVTESKNVCKTELSTSCQPELHQECRQWEVSYKRKAGCMGGELHVAQALGGEIRVSDPHHYSEMWIRIQLFT
jgi:hypothetical protein